MANQSDTQGTITLMKEDINSESFKLLHNYVYGFVMNDDYGINTVTYDEYDKHIADGNIILCFQGTGRWSMSEDCFNLQLNQESNKKQASALAKYLNTHKTSLQVEFLDYECGDMFLVKDFGEISGELGENGYELKYRLSNEKELDYTDYNKILHNFEEGIYVSSINETSSLVSLLKDYEVSLSSQELRTLANAIITDEDFNGAITCSNFETFIDILEESDFETAMEDVFD